jgi:hypothetical protein
VGVVEERTFIDLREVTRGAKAYLVIPTKRHGSYDGATGTVSVSYRPYYFSTTASCLASMSHLRRWKAGATCVLRAETKLSPSLQVGRGGFSSMIQVVAQTSLHGSDMPRLCYWGGQPAAPGPFALHEPGAVRLLAVEHDERRPPSTRRVTMASADLPDPPHR